MTVQTVTAALATLELNIAGVNYAYPEAPMAAPTSDLPTFLNFTGPASFDYRYADEKGQVIEKRDYRMVLLVRPAQAGSPGEAEAACKPFIPLVWAYFAARPSLGGLSGVQRARITRDGGVTLFTGYGEGHYYDAVEFTLTVEEYVKITYAASE